MTMPPQPSTHEAIEIVRRAIDEHGRPAWITYVPFRIRELVPLATMRELLQGPPQSEDIRVMPKEGREAILQFCMNNVFELVTVNQLSRLAGISGSTVRNLIKERPDIFRQADWRSYEIRDPKADRAIDKRKSTTNQPTEKEVTQ